METSAPPVLERKRSLGHSSGVFSTRTDSNDEQSLKGGLISHSLRHR